MYNLQLGNLTFNLVSMLLFIGYIMAVSYKEVIRIFSFSFCKTILIYQTNNDIFCLAVYEV